MGAVYFLIIYIFLHAFRVTVIGIVVLSIKLSMELLINCIVPVSWCVVYEILPFYDGRKVTYTTHQWYVVLEVFCVVYVGKPPTTYVGGVKWYVVLEVFCVVYVGKPPTTHVGGVKWYVMLEVFALCMSVNLYVVTFRPSYHSLRPHTLVVAVLN